MNDPVLSPRWVARLSAILLGWNVALISAFLFVATFVLLGKSGVSFQAVDIGAWLPVGFCILLAVFVGFFVGKIAYPWFQTAGVWVRTPPGSYPL
jgi:hypothetical protein